MPAATGSAPRRATAPSPCLGGAFARRVLFTPVSGRVLVKRLDAEANESVARAEAGHAQRLTRAGAAPDIELF